MNGWTEERIETLKALWMEGLSASEIAKKLGGVSRNAVLGKTHRMGWVIGSKTSPAVAKEKPIRDVHKRAPKGHRAAAESPVGIVAFVSSGTCAWPIGDPQLAGFRFCGARRARGSYCDEHAKRAYQPADAAKKARQEIERALRGSPR